jgi:hypothetical protein
MLFGIYSIEKKQKPKNQKQKKKKKTENRAYRQLNQR